MGAPFEATEREISDLIASLEAAGADPATLCEGYLAYGEVLFWNGRTAELVEVGKRALAYAQQAGDTVLEAEARSRIGVGTFYGPARWTEVEGYGRAALAEVERLGIVMLGARQGLAGAAAQLGRFEEARALLAEHRVSLEERGQELHLLAGCMHAMVLELLAGDFAAAEAAGRVGWDGLGLIDERGYRPTVGGVLAEALAELGRVDEAAAILDEAEAMAAADDWLTFAQCAWARAVVALQAGDLDEAVARAQEAAEIADARNYYPTRTHYRWGLARTLAAAGRAAEAEEALAEAERISELKGSVVYLQRIVELREQLTAAR